MFSRIRPAWLLLLMLVSSVAPAQQYSLTTYDRKSGLESQAINVLLQDRRGFVWAGTEMGLYRFDGNNFERMGLAQGFKQGEYITSLAQNRRAGPLWVATQSGLRVGDGLRFSPVEPGGKPLVVDVERHVVALDDGRLLLVKDDQLLVLSGGDAGQAWHLQPMFDDAQLADMPELRSITIVYAAPDRLWMGCGTALCSVDDDGNISLYGPAQGVPADTWTGLLQDSRGDLWLRGVHHVLTRRAGGDHFVARNLPAIDMGVVSDNGNLVEDSMGRVLTPTNRGLARWEGDHWTMLGSDNGLPDIELTAVMFDQQDSLWMGTYGRGISRWNGYGLVEGWGRNQGFDSIPTWSILRFNDEQLWFANELGGSVLERGQTRLRPWPLQFTPAPRQILSLAKAPDGAIWAALYDHRVLRYDPVSQRTTLAAQLPAFVRVLHFDRRGQLWIATTNGIYRIASGGAPAEHIPVDQATDKQCSDIAEGDDGSVWFSCHSGVLRYSGGQWTRMQADRTDIAAGFSTIEVDADGSLWLGASQPGVFHATVQSDKLALQQIEDPWLDNTLAYFVRRDHRGWIWVGGGGGVDVFDGQRWTHLSQADGLLWDETTQNGFFEDDDGSVWIGSAIGVSHILQPEAMLADHPSQVLITSAMHGATPVASGDTVRFSDNQAALIVRYAVLGSPSGESPRFRYRLRGSAWIESDNNVIQLTGLPANHYRLEVQAIDDDHRNFSRPAFFEFHIPPPWWRTWWAGALAGAGLLLLVWLIWRWRSGRLLAQNRRLEAMVDGRTLELTEEKRELELARAELYHQATHDSLTGLNNRRAILDQLARWLEPGERPVPGLAVGLIDADHFKHVNDTYGHLAGDAALVAIASKLRSLVREDDRLGRYGGEEILLLLPGITCDDAAQRVRNLQMAVSDMPHHWDESHFVVSLSVGLVWIGSEPATVQDLIQRADAALYVAKGRGRNRVEIESGSPAKGGEDPGLVD